MSRMKKCGSFAILLGVGLVMAALLLSVYNEREQRQAQQAGDRALLKIKEVRRENQSKTLASNREQAENEEISEIEIDGERYIGQLNVPELRLELPVMSEWSYPKLKKAPCRYCGCTERKNLVILGHNYKRHFGGLKNLKAGSQIQFQDISGKTQNYRVTTIETAEPTSVEKAASNENELTLFTCTYSGKYRTVIHCAFEDSE